MYCDEICWTIYSTGVLEQSGLTTGTSGRAGVPEARGLYDLTISFMRFFLIQTLAPGSLFSFLLTLYRHIHWSYSPPPLRPV
jgi:hypothetical protein